MSDKSEVFALSNRQVSLRWTGFVVLLGCVGAYSWLALHFGRDVPWDYFNYHAYAVELFFHDRLAQDFFPAGLLGYLNPVGFLPLALARYFDLGSMATAVLLACLHSLNAFFLYLICRDLCVGRSMSYRLAMGVGWLLGAVTPVLLTHVGSTFVDPIGSAMVIAAVWLTVCRDRPVHMLLAGVLAGVATAVKLSNVGFALAVALAVVLPRYESPRGWWRRVSWCAVGMLLAFGLLQGYWSWKLQQVMGSPLFPLLNDIFKSPYYPESGTGTLRFVPHSWGGLASLPYEMAQGRSWVYLELPAPTLVPLVATLAALALGILSLVRMRAARFAMPVVSPEQRLLALLAVSVAAWLATSGNGRYGIAVFVLLGPALAVMLLKLLPGRYAVLALVLLGAAQLYTTGFVGVQRWSSSKWTPQFVSVDVPPQLAASPQLFLSVISPSHSEIVPYLHSESVFVNLRGAYSLPSEGSVYRRIETLIEKYGGRTQVLFSIPELEGLQPDGKVFVSRHSAILDRVGLRLLPEDCSTILVDEQAPLENRFNEELAAPSRVAIMSCKAVVTPRDPRLAELRHRAVQIMDAFEARCPDLFVPSRPQIEGVGQGWVRKYFNHDSIALSVQFNRDMIFYGLSGQTSPTLIGKASEWRRVVAQFRCELPGKGKRGIDFFNEYEKDSIWF